MATVSLEVKGLDKAIKGIEKDVQTFLTKADRKFKVAGARMEAYAKAAAPVDKGFHRRNIRHNASAPFLSTSMVASAEYASTLELGFFGLVGVSAHTRQTKNGPVQVSSHIRPMNRKPRPHIIPAAERALKQLIEDLDGLS